MRYILILIVLLFVGCGYAVAGLSNSHTGGHHSSGYSGYTSPTHRSYQHSVVNKHGYTPYQIRQSGNHSSIYNYRTGQAVYCSTYGHSTYCF